MDSASTKKRPYRRPMDTHPPGLPRLSIACSDLAAPQIACRRDGDRDAQAAVVAGAGGGGAAVNLGDGRDDGQAEPGAVVRDPVAEPLEWLEDAVHVGRADQRAGVGHRQLAAARDGAGADPDVAGRVVVPGRVLDQVCDEAL